MKSLFTLLVAVLIALSFSVTGFAATERSVKTDHMTTMGQDMVYSGKVVSVNDTDHTMVVKGKDGDKTFDVSNVNERVQAGHDVSVTYHDENGRMVASSVNGGMKTSRNYEKNAKMKTYKGEVVSFDKAKHEMVVKGTLKEERFDVSGAKINGTVKPGEKVLVTYYEENGGLFASSVVNSEVKVGKNERAKTPVANERYNKKQGA